MLHKRQIFLFRFILFSLNWDNQGGAKLLNCVHISECVAQNVQDGQCTVCNWSFHLIEFCQKRSKHAKCSPASTQRCFLCRSEFRGDFSSPRCFAESSVPATWKRSWEIEKECDLNVYVHVIACGPKPRLDFSHKIRVGRWSLGAGVENSNHYDLFGIFWTHLGKACKPDHQISDMNVSKSFFKHQFTLITARFARILLSFPLFVGNSLWLV